MMPDARNLTPGCAPAGCGSIRSRRARRRSLARAVGVIVAIGAISVSAFAQTPPPKAGETTGVEDLYEAGKALFDQYAPAEIKEQYEFPSKQQWDEFAARLQQALQNEDLTQLARYEPEARAALTALRVFPGYEDYADWLTERLDYIDAAKVTATRPAPRPPTPRPVPKPGQPATVAPLDLPYYDVWMERMRGRPTPERAGALMPILRAAFVAEGVPPEIAWLAEAESTLNPAARSPSGAKGLFQLMPDTAKGLGLKTFLPDERADPDKSARAAARYLRTLHDEFNDWPLVFAAYNGGEGRVRRLLKQKHADTFAEIAGALPSETRMYVPKVCATIAVRTGVPPEDLAAPVSPAS